MITGFYILVRDKNITDEGLLATWIIDTVIQVIVAILWINSLVN